MKRREFMAGVAALPFASRFVSSEYDVDAKEARAADATAGQIGHSTSTPGFDRYCLTRDRVTHGTGPAYTTDFLLEDVTGMGPRRFTNYSGDVSGRWIGALSTASLVFGEKFPQLDEAVQRTIALQKPDGYFGKDFHYDNPDDNDMALLWGNGRLLVGLTEYYALTHDARAMTSARKLGDFLIRIAATYNSQKMADEFGAAHFASGYICWTQQTEGLAALYAATKDVRYRDLCSEIASRTQRRPADHVHGYLCSVRGTLDLFNATGDARYLLMVETSWQEIMQSGDILVTGGVPEAWSPHKVRTEGCAEADWLRLNLKLWEATGDEKYIAMAERTAFNELAMNQFSSGDFGHAMLDEKGAPHMVYVRAWWCCTLHGLRAFPDVARAVFRARENDAVTFVLPMDGAIRANGLELYSTSSLASDGTIAIRVAKASGQSLRIRKPAWAAEVAVSRNGAANGGLEVARLATGDVIRLRYDFGVRQETQTDQSIAVLKGPWLLGVASEKNPKYFNELYLENTLLTETAKPSDEASHLPFDVPLAATRYSYIDAEVPDQSHQVVFRAVAEQTSMPPTPWQLLFQAPKSSA